MQVIYETINHWNYFYGINPWRYIGSDEKCKSDYFGSNVELREDVKILGEEFFEKKIIAKFDKSLNLSNVELRQCESVIQKSLNCAKDESYYNRSNASFKGYIDLTKEQKRRRYEILKNGRLTWLKNGGKTIQSKLSNYENWTKKYGKEVADQKLKEQRKRKSGNRNGMFKYNDQQKNEIKELYLTGLYTRVNISKMTGVNYSTVKNLLTGIKGLRKKENLIKTL